MATKQKFIQNGPAQWQIPSLREGDHKYQRGHVLILGGAQMTGASRMAALAAQRVGAGVVTLAVPESAYPIYAAAMMSVIVRPLKKKGDFAWVLKNRKITAVVLGPGADPDEVREPLKAGIASGLPLILDAGALELLAQDAKLRKKLSAGNVVLLPHEGEYKKLAQAMKVEKKTSKRDRAVMLAKTIGGIVLLKGAETFITAPKGPVIRNYQKAPWLATAGAGDVLAGIVAGLAGQGMKLADASAAGAWIHGKAAESFGRGMIAEDVIQAIPVILKTLKS